MTTPTKLLFSTVAAVALAIYMFRETALDGPLGFLTGPDSTEYAASYSTLGFMRVKVGMNENDVEALVGQPLSKRFEYESGVVFWFGGDGRLSRMELPNNVDDSWRAARLGMAADEIMSTIGEPTTCVWNYSRRTRDTSYRVRLIHFRIGKVEKRVAEWYFD